MFFIEVQVYMSLKQNDIFYETARDARIEDIAQRNIIDLCDEFASEYHHQDIERHADELYMQEVEKGNCIHEKHNMQGFQQKCNVTIQ